MANTTDKSILTAAGKALLAQLNAEEKPLIIDKMIFANVPNRQEYPQPDDVVPTDNVVHQEAVEQRGRLSADSVIYSTTLTSDVGPFDFNWTGAYCSEYGVLVTIDHHALTPKTADEPGVAGNTLVRSVVLEYKDIAEITNITVDASTWQYNANERMKKMDTDVAQAIIDQNGKDWFIEDGFLVTPQASAFNIKAGAGYVSGNRVTLEFDRNVQAPNKPSFIYVDAHREGTPTGEQVTLFDFVVTTEEKDDYTDANGVKHFVCKIAQVLADGSVSDLRPEGESASRKYVNDGDLSTARELAIESSIIDYKDSLNITPISGEVMKFPGSALLRVPSFLLDGTSLPEEAILDSKPDISGFATVNGGLSVKFEPISTVFISSVQDVSIELNPAAKKAFIAGQQVHASRYYAGGDLVYELIYDVVPDDPGAQGLFNHTLSNGLYLKLKNPQLISQAGARKNQDVTNILNQCISYMSPYKREIALGSDYFIAGTLYPDKNTSIDGRGAVLTNNTQLLFDIASGKDDVTLRDFTLDGQGKDISRIINIQRNVKRPKLLNLLFKNVSSSTFLRCVDFSDDGVEGFEFNGLGCVNITAAGNDIVGDIDGMCRLIQMNNYQTTATTNPSSGKIRNTSGRKLGTREDGDLIHLQSDSDREFSIEVENTFGAEIAKRLIKIQANGIKVKGSYADARDNTEDMWSIVSAYGKNCTVLDTFGIGRVFGAVDTEGDNNKVRNSELIQYVKAANSFVVLVAKGANVVVSASNGVGVDDIVRARTDKGSISRLKVSDVSGVAERTLVSASVNSDNNFDIDDLDIGDVYGRCAGTTHAPIDIFKDPDATGLLKNVSLGDVNLKTDGYFICANIRDVDDLDVSDMKASGHTSTALQLARCTEVDLNNISGAKTTVKMIDCVDTISTNIKRGSEKGIHYIGGDDHIADGVYVRKGANPVYQDEANLPTNVQVGSAMIMNS
ncbi:phage tail protein [Photobacterium sp. DA100]|uniref:phage tail-collar fiber domain-containing protein n=1 Tax=Photobacterium sp. DA100 TaxID=3027472 RepID=UPI002479627A|nr:phage tail protein [Photobacterium sp. DA100]WEM43521.1 phage tail protein [Photobacterium sp. DA100]